MRKIIQLNHQVCDFNCMLSGLEDLYEQESHLRLPQYLLFIGGYIGFKYEIKPNQKIQRVVEPGYGVGRVHYDFLAEILGFDWRISEGDIFESAWEKMKRLIDKGHPVVLGELDMFHLPYLKKFYHRIHVPFHYVTLIGYDDQKATALIQDCGRLENQEIPLLDLRKALNREVVNLCRKNTFFWFEFTNETRARKTEKEMKGFTVLSNINLKENK